ncbi:transporter substrate-binding domain-containing protein [Gordonia soli]|uniref:Putative ABC transporter substrate-binding protein n=1 Tax=Gordonia soli NBRC 108243 TaxID=1223545 RepID=M0QFZ1_9ACTN|nr:transporter substrate-binding domain-containing protein [Gordonia soli]GAC67540.1 putative ABC transporter substrate-binding protein [Gordonia soli NBRC 108243]
MSEARSGVDTPGPAQRRGRLGAARLILILGAVLLVGTACVRFPAPPSDPPTATAVPPTPPGARTDVPREPTPNSETCDATVSLRPPAQMPVPGQMPVRSTMADILGRGRLIVGLDTGSNLFSFRDPITGDIQGFDVDIARAIAQAIFGEPTVEYKVLSSGDRIRALHDGTVDVVVKTMSITCDRVRDVAFSTPYYVASQRILVMRNSQVTTARGLAGKRVCAARGVTSIGRMQSIEPRAKMVTTTTWADCLVMMQQGEVDAATTDDAILAGLAEQDPWVQVVGPSLGEEYYGVGMAQGHDDLVRFVNGVLDQLRISGGWQQIYNRWLSILGTNYPPIPVYRE